MTQRINSSADQTLAHFTEAARMVVIPARRGMMLFVMRVFEDRLATWFTVGAGLVTPAGVEGQFAE